MTKSDEQLRELADRSRWGKSKAMIISPARILSQLKRIEALRESLDYYANYWPGLEIRDGGDKARAALAEDDRLAAEFEEKR